MTQEGVVGRSRIDPQRGPKARRKENCSRKIRGRCVCLMSTSAASSVRAPAAECDLVLLRAGENNRCRDYDAGKQKRHPSIAVEMATVRRPVVLDDSVEMAISYSRHAPPVAGAVELLKDLGLPMAVSGLSAPKSGRARDIRSVPLISSTPDDWDWRGWAQDNNIEFDQLRIAYRFDCECAALTACRGGLGVALFLPRSALPRSRAGCWCHSAAFRSGTSAATGLPRRPGCADRPRSSGPGCSRWRPASNLLTGGRHGPCGGERRHGSLCGRAAAGGTRCIRRV